MKKNNARACAMFIFATIALVSFSKSNIDSLRMKNQGFIKTTLFKDKKKCTLFSLFMYGKS
jgi:hypothetical protein